MTPQAAPTLTGKSFFVIFTDLDGTLLDHETYRWDAASEAVELCKERGVPLIPVSSKTRAEMELIRNDLGLEDPFVTENGGGIFFPRESHPEPPRSTVFRNGFWEWDLGRPYGELIIALREIRAALGWKIRGFSDMGVEEIARLTGLDAMSARLAAERDFDEPFVIEPTPPDLGPLERAVAGRGLRLSRGGRFFHLHGENDKGMAMERLLDWYRKQGLTVRSIALGDSPNDFSMLERADYPVLVAPGQGYGRLKDTISRLTITRQRGPRGWNEAVMEILGSPEEDRHG